MCIYLQTYEREQTAEQQAALWRAPVMVIL
jgi:hypothetical protein